MSMPKKNGRSSIYTEAIAEEICTRLAAGESLNGICKDLHMPAEATVRGWVQENHGGFGASYARAREQGYERWAEEILQIADADCAGPDGRPDNALVQQARLRVDARKWLLSKLLPKKYGDRIEIGTDPDTPLVTKIELIPVFPRQLEPLTIEAEVAPAPDRAG